ncbi:MAG: diguanylate cyclase [Spirochaetales bacterium]|nr:diguanylate cyclase [Spirochaetales bacterium]
MRTIVLIIGVVLLVASIFAIQNNMGVSKISEPVIDGMLDVGKADSLDKPVRLYGRWFFAPNRFDDPGSALDQESYHLVDVPSSWTDYEISQQSLSNEGFATYRLSVHLPAAGTYGLLIDNIYTAYRLYVDGNLLCEVGSVSDHKETATPRFTDTIVTFTSSDDIVDIMFHVSNFYHPRSGIIVAPMLGYNAQLTRIMLVSTMISILLVGILVISALFMLYFHHSLNKDASIIVFAILCFVLAIRIMAANSMLAVLVPSLPTALISKIEYISIAIVVSLIAIYSQYAFQGMMHRTLVDITAGISAAYALTILFAPIGIYYRLFVPYTVLYSLILLYWVISMTIAFFRKKEIPLTIILAVWVCVLSIMMQALYYFLGIPNLFINHIAGIGTVFFIIVHFHHFSLRFIEAYAVSKRTSKQLEQEVLLRTAELGKLNDDLKKAAATDALTGLNNTSELYRRMEKDAEQYNRELSFDFRRPFSVAYIDLDNFKFFNDTYTHKGGDLVLAAFAKHLSTIVPGQQQVFRAGGDEFIVFLPDVDFEEAQKVAKNLLDSLESFSRNLESILDKVLDKVVLKPTNQNLGCSIGISVHETGPLILANLIQDADKALYEAKTTGKKRFCINIEESF